MAITDADIEDLLGMLDRGRQSWIDGTLGYGTAMDIDQDEDWTIFGSFGGEAGRGSGLEDRQRRAARLFHGGVGANELVRTIVADDIAVVILVERNSAIVDGSDEPQPWVLRTTQVFEKRPDGWVRLHRHADPLIDRRSPTDTFTLARGEMPPGV